MTNKKTKLKQRQDRLLSIRNLPVVVVTLVVAVIGYILLSTSHAYTGHHASCSAFAVTPGVVSSSNPVATATYKMTNDGSTTWSSAYAFWIQDRWGKVTYTAGNLFTTNVPPGGVYNGHTTVKAPTAPGTYPVAPEVYALYVGGIAYPCPTIGLTVQQPVGITSFTGTPQTITVGQTATLQWTVTGSSVACKVNGSLASPPLSVKPTTTTSYTLNCYNQISNKSAGPIKITVNPAPPPSGGSSHHSSGGSSTPTPSPTPSESVDSSPPSVPGNFNASVDNTTKGVKLTWDASTDNVGVTGYILERSTDAQQGWQQVGDSLTDTSYEDLTTGFETVYYYRLHAVDAAGNSSDYAMTQVSTTGFAANAQADKDNTISSDDKNVAVLIPAGSLSQDAFCSLDASSDTLAPNIDNYVYIAGPYELNCRDTAGNLITNFSKPLVLSAHVDKSHLKGIGALAYFGQKDDGSWQKLSITKHNGRSSTDTVNLDKFHTFAIMGQHHKGNIWLKLFEVIIILALILFGIRFVIRLLLKRKAQQQYEDYMRKSQGL